VADGFVSDRWAPFSPVTGHIDAFEWKAPTERAPQMIEQEDAPAASGVKALPRAGGGTPKDDASGSRDTDTVPVADDVVEIDFAPDEDEPVAEPKAPATGRAEAVEDKQDRRAGASQEAAGDEQPAGGSKPPARAKPQQAEVVAFSRPPDDPGVDPEDDTEESKSRFRLF
jgi:HemY protein